MTTNIPETPTLEELKKHRSFEVAEILIYKKRIFRCSLEEAWDRYMHPAINHSHKKEDVIEIAEHILQIQSVKEQFNKKVKKETGYECILEEHNLIIRCTKIDADKYHLDIYSKDKERLYRHVSPIVYPFGTVRTILRKKFNVRRVVLKWSQF